MFVQEAPSPDQPRLALALAAITAPYLHHLQPQQIDAFNQPAAEQREPSGTDWGAGGGLAGGRGRAFTADGANKGSICPANKDVGVSPEGNVGKLASYPSLGGGGMGRGVGPGLNSLLEIHTNSSRFTRLC